MNAYEFQEDRPYWLVDAKWITGILLLFLLNVTLLLFVLVQGTGPKPGVDLLTVLLASSFSREGLDQEADPKIRRQKIAESPSGAWQPIPSLTPREMRLGSRSIMKAKKIWEAWAPIRRWRKARRPASVPADSSVMKSGGYHACRCQNHDRTPVQSAFIGAVYCGIVTGPPMLPGASPLAAAVITFFAHIFYGCIILVLAKIMDWMRTR